MLPVNDRQVGVAVAVEVADREQLVGRQVEHAVAVEIADRQDPDPSRSGRAAPKVPSPVPEEYADVAAMRSPWPGRAGRRC